MQKLMQQIWKDHAKMSVDSLIELKNWIEDYPYCQTAQILYLLNLKRLEEDTFDVRLPFTAVCVHNRQLLKQHVEKIEEIVAKEAKKSTHSKPEPIQETKSFHNKTISDLLNLSKKPTESTHVNPPQPTADDILLEQLRLDALAKVNDRLNELRKVTQTAPAKPSEGSKNIVSAKDLIDKVIATNPKISKVEDSDTKQKSLTHWKAKEEHSLREDYELVSETLARLYVEQGAPAKAREIYKTLAQKFPEKKAYFTQLSKQIKTIQKPKTKK